MFDHHSCLRRQWSGDGYPRRPQAAAGRRRAVFKSRAPSGRASEATGCGRTEVTCLRQYRGGISGVCSPAPTETIESPTQASFRALREKREMCSLRLGRNVILPGQYYDVESGLNYNYFRDYDPAGGRYVESDPLGLQAGINTYAYVGSDPLSFIDPFGLDETHVVNTSGGRSVWDGPTNGNWGGKCWSGGQYSCGGHPIGTKPTTDSADKCYMHHDNCYDKCSAIKDGKAQKACIKVCDAALVKELKLLPDDPAKWPEPPRKGTENDSNLYRNGAIRIFSP